MFVFLAVFIDYNVLDNSVIEISECITGFLRHEAADRALSGAHETGYAFDDEISSKVTPPVGRAELWPSTR